MSLKSIFISIAFMLLIGGCVYSTYNWVDLSISYSYLKDSYEGQDKNTEILVSLLEKELEDMDRATLIQKLEAYKKLSGSDIFIKEETGNESVSFGTIVFVFQNGKLGKIKPLM